MSFSLKTWEGSKRVLSETPDAVRPTSIDHRREVVIEERLDDEATDDGCLVSPAAAAATDGWRARLPLTAVV